MVGRPTGPALARFVSDEDPAQVFHALERDGAVVVEGLLPEPVARALRDDFQPHLDAVAWCNTADGLTNEFFGHQTKRLHGLLARSPRFADVVVHPLLRAMCDHFLAPRTRDYRVSTGELMVLGEGQGDQLLHRDADSWLHFPEPRPEILVSANFALTDFTADNGATRVVPGSHRWSRERKPQDDEVGQATMPLGSALLYSGNVLHGGGSNQTDEVRIGLYVGYLLSWLRPIENHVVTNGLEALRAAPPEAQRLLDFTESGWEAFA